MMCIRGQLLSAQCDAGADYVPPSLLLLVCNNKYAFAAVDICFIEDHRAFSNAAVGLVL
jgi:hypothetical protein